MYRNTNGSDRHQFAVAYDTFRPYCGGAPLVFHTLITAWRTSMRAAGSRQWTRNRPHALYPSFALHSRAGKRERVSSVGKRVHTG